MIHDPGKPLEYEKWFRAAVAVRPRSPVARNYLGLALLNGGRLREAAAEFRESVKQEPKYAGAHNNLGVALDNLGDKAGATAAFRKAVESAPDYWVAQGNLGTLLEEAGDFEGAARHYAGWVKCDPDTPLAMRRLAWVLATAPDGGVRNGRRAVELASRSCELTKGKEPEYLDVLAAALAEAGEFEKAVDAETRALASAEFEKKSGAAARRRLSLYRRKFPYRMPHVAPPPHELKQP
jgi:Flp pilus assembly protein TadD